MALHSLVSMLALEYGVVEKPVHTGRLNVYMKPYSELFVAMKAKPCGKRQKSSASWHEKALAAMLLRERLLNWQVQAVRNRSLVVSDFITSALNWRRYRLELLSPHYPNESVYVQGL